MNFLISNLLTVTAEYPQEDWAVVGSTVITGMLVVFSSLVILIFAFWLLGVIFAPKSGKKRKNAESFKLADSSASFKLTESAEKQGATPAPPKPEPAPEADGGELIAVIGAAVAAYGASEGADYKITSIKKREKKREARSSWAQAGINENTRRF